MRTCFLAQVLLGGILVFVGCDAPELAAPETEVHGVLFDEVGDDDDDDDDEGPQGPAGISGFEKVIRFFARPRVNNNVNIETFSAACPAGKEILGGGYAIEPIELPGPPLASRPSASAGWEVTLEWDFSFPGQTLDVTVYALCAIAA